ncbi:hypothetical protein N9P17_02630 [Tateyamaria sp.]|nr:hypothetical protein [Tateyamaria sp.]
MSDIMRQLNHRLRLSGTQPNYLAMGKSHSPAVLLVVLVLPEAIGWV